MKRDLAADLKLCNKVVDFCEFRGSAEEATANADFIAAAREGWPHAIRRAMAAEARVAELEEAILAAMEFIDVGFDDKADEILGKALGDRHD